MHEGEGKVLRFGVYDESVGDHLVWMRDVLGAGLSKALKLLPDGGLAVNPILAQAVTMGDEFHVRITAASSLMFRELAPKLVQVGLPQAQLESVLDFLAGNINFFLTLGMASGKAVLDAAATVEAGSVVTCMTRNGREFAIRVSGLGDRWFTGPEDELDTLYFPGFSDEDACPDCGDSAILEAYGLGGPVAVAAPAVQQMVGTGEGGFEEALATSEEQTEIMVTQQPEHADPELELQGRARRNRHPQGRRDGNRPPDHHGRHAQEGRDRDGRDRQGPSLDAVLHLGPRGPRRSARRHGDGLS